VYRALSIQFRAGLVALAVGFVILLMLPSEGLEALGGFLALYFVFLLHLPMVPQLLYYFWRGYSRNWLIWTMTAYLTVMMGTALAMFIVVNEIDSAVLDQVDAFSDPDGYEMRDRAQKLYRDSAAGESSQVDRSFIKSQLVRVEDINASDKSHRPVLWYLATVGDEELVSIALAQGASVDYPSESASPLHQAVSGGHADVTRQLIRAGASPETEWRGHSVLDTAVDQGHVDVARVLIEEGATVEGGRMLSRAVQRGDAVLLELLLESGIEPGIDSSRLVDRPLRDDNEAVIDVLNRYGFGLDFGGNKDPVIFEALSRCDLDELSSLLDRGASPDVVNRRGHSVLAHAVTLSTQVCDFDGVRSEVVVRLLEAGAQTDVTTFNGSGIVAAALAKGHLDEARTLIEAGASLEPGARRRSVLMLAARLGADDIIEQAIDAGQSATEWTEGGNPTSALREAVAGGHAELVRDLFDLGAYWRHDISERNGFRLAASNHEVLRALLDHYELRTEGYQNMMIRRTVEEHGDEKAVIMLAEYGL